jgi:hypothetical protein
MASVFPVRVVSDDTRRANDQHRHWVAVFVVLFLALVAYLWTDWMAEHPLPGVEALRGHDPLKYGFSRHGHLASSSWIHYGDGLGSHPERHILFLLTGIGFLLSYYLPLEFKKQPLVFLTFFGVAWVIGPAAAGELLAWHLFAFSTFHIPDPRRGRTVVGTVLLAVSLWGPKAAGGSSGELVAEVVLTTMVVLAAYRFVYHPLLESGARPWLQAGMAHASMLYLLIAFLWNVLAGGNSFPHPIGLVLLLWQWERLVMYQIDLKDGRVPPDLPLLQYLATFFSPAFLANISWLNRIPKGYAYMAGAFLARDKNRIVLSGVKLIALSVLFFSLRPIFLRSLRIIIETFGLPRWTSYGHLVEAMEAGKTPSVLSVWLVLIYAFMSFYLLWTAAAHLRVGLWRLFGYDIEPYFQKPFTSTNLLDWWARYSYYYKEFLVQAFYYPVFLRFFRKRPYVRTFVATLAAAGGGNMLFHFLEASLYRGVTPAVWMSIVRTTPYYLLIGGAIALTQVWLMRRGRRRRKPWTLDRRIGLDVLAVAGTVGFFMLIRPFHHVPVDHSVADSFRVVLAALGVR